MHAVEAQARAAQEQLNDTTRLDSLQHRLNEEQQESAKLRVKVAVSCEAIITKYEKCYAPSKKMIVLVILIEGAKIPFKVQFKA